MNNDFAITITGEEVQSIAGPELRDIVGQFMLALQNAGHKLDTAVLTHSGEKIPLLATTTGDNDE